MDFHASTHVIGTQPTVILDGVVDLASVPQLRDVLHRTLLDHPGATLVVDLDGVLALDDCGLGILTGEAATARERGGDIELVATTASMRARLTATRLDRLLTVRSTVV